MFCSSVMKRMPEWQKYEGVCTRKLRPDRKIRNLLQLFNSWLLEENEN